MSHWRWPIPRSRSAGFTLLETLVTVTIFALLFAVLMAGWFQALKAQSRLTEVGLQLQQQQRISVSLRQLMAEILSPRVGRGTVFAGTRRSLLAESSSSLAPGVGSAPLPTGLQIEGPESDLRLRIEHPGLGAETFPWRLLLAQLRYRDASGNWSDTWPPASDRLVLGAASPEPSALPALIELTVQFEAQARPMILLVAPRATPWQLFEPTTPFEVKLE